MKRTSKNSLVKAGYNQVAGNYSAARDAFSSLPYLKPLADKLARGSTVLDVGCGSALPIDRFLVDQGFHVIGIDIFMATS